AGDAGRRERAGAVGPAGRGGRGGGAKRGDRADGAGRAGGLATGRADSAVVIRHALQRDAIYAGMTADRRPELHPRAITLVDEASGWAHRVAALDRPDEDLAAQLESLAGGEAASGRLALAATHLRWASDISPGRADRERRLLNAALHLMLAEEA